MSGTGFVHINGTTYQLAREVADDSALESVRQQVRNLTSHTPHAQIFDVVIEGVPAQLEVATTASTVSVFFKPAGGKVW